MPLPRCSVSWPTNRAEKGIDDGPPRQLRRHAVVRAQQSPPTPNPPATRLTIPDQTVQYSGRAEISCPAIHFALREGVSPDPSAAAIRPLPWGRRMPSPV